MAGMPMSPLDPAPRPRVPDVIDDAAKRRAVRRALTVTERNTPVAPDPALFAKAAAVHERLCHEYRCPIAHFHSLDPLSELIAALLAHRTRSQDAADAFTALREAYPTWEDVLDAPTKSLQKTITSVAAPELKAPRIKEVLQRILDSRGTLSLDFLRSLEMPAAIAWLRTLPGVGAKTATAVLSFSTLRRATIPVDSHHHRVAERLGLIPRGTSLEAAHAILAAQLPAGSDAQHTYDNHEVLALHGQRCCYYREPACERCVVATLCPSCRVSINPT